MKNTYVHITHGRFSANRQGIKLFFILAALALIACERREEPEQFVLDAKPAYAVPETASTISFSVTSNIPWTAEVTAGSEWCHITPASAKGSGKIVISVTANTDYRQERTAVIVVKAGAFSQKITVTQAAAPCPAFNPGSIAATGQTVTVGGTPATINSLQAATGGGVISYRWYKNGIVISNATAASYTPPTADAATLGAYTYTRRAKDAACNTTFTPSAGSWVLHVTCPAFNAGSIAATGQTVTVGGTPATINSLQAATGYGTISYQWYKNGNAISDAIAASYTPPLSDATLTGAITYTRKAKDSTCNIALTQSVGSWVLNVICNFNPGSIVATGQTVTVGGTPATINSLQAATGYGTISYQWYKNGNAISGATAASYTPPLSDAAVTGAYTYTRRAKDNTCNTTFTPSAGSWVLHVTCPAFNAGSIAATGQTVTVGGTPATINSLQAATGYGTISYQWYKNGNAISNATAASYTPPLSDATVTGAITYTRRAKDNTCNITFTPSAGSWVLHVTCPAFNPGSIAATGQTVTVGGTPATINSLQAATGYGTISYQWYKNGNAISGATATNYTPPLSDATVTGAITYTRRAKDNTCNTTFTPSAGSWVLHVTCPAFNAGSIAATGQTVTVGGTPATINSLQAATGYGTISYQWYKNGNIISNATAASYTPPTADAATLGAYTYTRRAKDNTCNTTFTPSAGSWVLHVTCPAFNPGSIAVTGQTVTVGGTPATINSLQDATGAGISYQWYKNGVAISNATAASYRPPTADAATLGAYTYTRRAKDNTCNTTFTPSAGSWVLNVICNFNAGSIAATGQTVTVGGTPATINSLQDATGGGVISYQWYKNGIAISNATAASYTPPTADATTLGAYTYTRQAKDAACNTTFTPSAGSWVLHVTCPAFNAGSIAATGQTVTVGGTPATINSLQAATGGGIISYQWYKNGVAISNATAASYRPPTADAATLGAYTYTRRAKDNTCNTTFTPSAGSWVLHVTCPAFNPGSIAAASLTICGSTPGTINSLQAATGGSGAITYEWRHNGTPIYNTNTATYQPVAYRTTTGTHTFTRWAHDSGCNAAFVQSSGQWALIVHDAPTISLTSANNVQSVTFGDPITPIKYTTANASGAVDNNLPPGVTGSWANNTYTISGTPSAAGAFTYTVATTNGKDCINKSLYGTLTVSRPLPPSAGTKTYAVCSQVWSDPVNIAACDKHYYTPSKTSPECRSYTWNNVNYYYYSWVYVKKNMSEMCPYPWRVPTVDDFETLLTCSYDTHGTADILQPASHRWSVAFAGYTSGGNMYFLGSTELYWSSTAYIDGYTSEAFYNTGSWYDTQGMVFDIEDGLMVRCVK